MRWYDTNTREEVDRPHDLPGCANATDADLIAAGVYPILASMDTTPEGGQLTGWTYEIDSGGQSVTRTATFLTAAEVAQAQADAETAMQFAKSPELKTVENTFLSMCDQLTGNTTHMKQDFATLENILFTMEQTNAVQALTISNELLMINEQGQKYGGLQWYDTCTWHQDIVQ